MRVDPPDSSSGDRCSEDEAFPPEDPGCLFSRMDGPCLLGALGSGTLPPFLTHPFLLFPFRCVDLDKGYHPAFRICIMHTGTRVPPGGPVLNTSIDNIPII
jgi:hypothetical protein